MKTMKALDVSVRLFDANTIDPTAATPTDWADVTGGDSFDGFLKGVKLDEPSISRTTENYIGSDSSGVQYQEVYVDDIGTAKISGSMVIVPDAVGNYIDLDSWHLTQVATGTDIRVYKFGGDGETTKQLLVVIGKNSGNGVRYLMNNVQVNKLNAFDVPDKGVITVEYEFECKASDLYKQVANSNIDA